MEWILLKSMFIIFTTIQVRGLLPGPGVCEKTLRVEHNNKPVTSKHCCNNYYQIDERCIECPIGHFSKGDNCTKCVDERYGHKCAEKCRCNSTERCDNVKGCIPVDAVDGRTTYKTVKVSNSGGQTADKTVKVSNAGGQTADKTVTVSNAGGQTADIERITPSVENKKEGDIIISIALWEFILIIIIILISLFILCELLHKYRKRRRRVLTNPLNDTEIETHTIRRGHQEDEERIESVYNEIDESAMNTLIPRNILRHSYFEITNSLSSTMHTKVSSIPNSLCLSRLSLQSLLLRQTRLRVQRNNEEEINNDLHIVVGSEYSDGYLRPMSIAQLQSMDIMIEHQGTALPNNENVLRIQNDEYFYMECCSAGSGSSMSYNTLKLKGVKNQTKGICVVDNPIYNETMYRHPKYATWSSKRKTI